MEPNVGASAMFPSGSSCCHGPPLLGRVRACPRSPASPLVCGPPTPLRHPPRLWFPSPSAYPEPSAFLSRPRVRPGTRGAPEAWGLGPPPPQCSSGTVRGLPGYWALLVPRAAASDPAGTRPPSPTTGGVACGLQGSGPPGLPGRRVFEARARAAHGLACLRIPGGVTVARARLATDRRGCALVGRDSHPLDGGRNFVRLPHGHSFPTRIAWSHPEFAP